MERASTVSEPLPDNPKLAIWHVMLWMACVAVVAAWKVETFGLLSASWQMQVHQLVARVSYCILAGLALAGLALAIGCAMGRRRYYPVTAGHWLLTASGMVMLISEASNTISDAWHRASPGIDHLARTHHVMIYSFASIAIVYLSCSFVVREPWPWRFVFLGYAAPCLLWSIVNSMHTFGNQSVTQRWSNTVYAIQWPWQWLLFAVIVFLSIIDVHRHRRRDWLHWTGIGYFVSWVCSESLLTVLHAWIAR
jgi:hypothetical protein